MSRTSAPSWSSTPWAAAAGGFHGRLLHHHLRRVHLWRADGGRTGSPPSPPACFSFSPRSSPPSSPSFPAPPPAVLWSRRLPHDERGLRDRLVRRVAFPGVHDCRRRALHLLHLFIAYVIVALFKGEASKIEAAHVDRSPCLPRLLLCSVTAKLLQSRTTKARSRIERLSRAFAVCPRAASQH